MTDQIELPPRDKARWRAADKAAVIRAIQAGQIALEAAIALYNASPEELAAWSTTLANHGVKGLAATSNAVHWYRGRKYDTR